MLNQSAPLFCHLLIPCHRTQSCFSDWRKLAWYQMNFLAIRPRKSLKYALNLDGLTFFHIQSHTTFFFFFFIKSQSESNDHCPRTCNLWEIKKENGPIYLYIWHWSQTRNLSYYFFFHCWSKWNKINIKYFHLIRHSPPDNLFCLCTIVIRNLAI